jgi:hypothetical protein
VTTKRVPAQVQAVADTFLQAIDAKAPALIEGLYLVGSVAQDDFRPHRSDIDFVAVMTHRPDAATLAALERVHADLQQRWRRPFFDGIYVTRDDLASDPRQIDHCPTAHEGKLQPAGAGDLIAWHTLAWHGVRVHGPAVDELAVWTDADALAAWTDDNLDTYWQRRVLDPGARLLSLYGLVGLTAWACEWCVTGVSRLHYTLATGAITSKEGAGIYALATFPARWHRVIEEALRIRRVAGGHSLYRWPLSRRRDVLAFTAMVIADAHRLYQERGTIY